MADGRPPTIGFVRPPGEPEPPLVSGLVAELAAAGWRTRVLGRAPVAGRRLRVLHVPSAALAHEWVSVGRRLGARTVVSLRAEESDAVDADAWRGADALHADSEKLAALVRNGSEGRPAPVVIDPPADPVLLAEEPSEGPAGAPLRLLSVGALSWTQGYEFALAAVAQLAERGVPFEYRIVGTGPHRDAVAFARHQLGLDDSVEMADAADRDALRDHLRWAGALVDASVLAPSPGIVLDAQAAGVPVVTTHSHGAGSASVMTVQARDPEALCEALARLAGDAELRTRIVSAGRDRARQAPTTEQHCARWRDLYSELASA